MQDIAGKWYRVSTSGQDEASQVPEVEAWVTSHGYQDGPVYTVHGASAHKGNKKFDEMWAQVISDIKAGKLTVLVVWKLDRIDRKLATFQMLQQVLDAGGRVEFVTQPHLNDLTTMGGRIALKVQEEIAYAESKDKSDRVKIAHAAIRANGGVIGRPPFGYINDGPIRYRRMVPTADGRLYVPQMFRMVADGISLRTIALWLDSHSVKPNSKAGQLWADKSIAQYIRNTAYIGSRRDADGVEVATCEALVSDELWQAANDRLSNSPKGQRGPRTAMPAMLKGILECAECGGNMYRIKSGYKASRTEYYRCSGKAPQPKGCGAPMVKVTDLDEWVNLLMSMNDEPYITAELVIGTDTEGEIKRLNLEIKALDNRVKADRVKARELSARIDELEDMDIVSDHYEQIDSGKTWAQMWDACQSDDDCRALLAEQGMRFTFKWTVDSNGARTPLCEVSTPAWADSPVVG